MFSKDSAYVKERHWLTLGKNFLLFLLISYENFRKKIHIVQPNARGFCFDRFLSDHLVCGDATWSYHRGSCYKLIPQHKDYLSAVQHCKGLQSHLVEIQNQNENGFVARLSHDEDMWIGLSDRKKEGKWVWETSRKFAKKIYTRWNPGEPNNKGGGNGRAHCALIWRYYNLETWDDRNCAERKYFVCERGKEAYLLVKNGISNC